MTWCITHSDSNAGGGGGVCNRHVPPPSTASANNCETIKTNYSPITESKRHR